MTEVKEKKSGRYPWGDKKIVSKRRRTTGTTGTDAKLLPGMKAGYTRACKQISFGWEGNEDDEGKVETTGFRVNLHEYEEGKKTVDGRVPIYATIAMDRKKAIWLRDTIDKYLNEYPE